MELRTKGKGFDVFELVVTGTWEDWGYAFLGVCSLFPFCKPDVPSMSEEQAKAYMKVRLWLLGLLPQIKR